MKLRVGWVLPMLVLAGCGPRTDDPANLPALGHWQREVKLAAIVANDVWVEREQVPVPLPPDGREDKGCIEPGLRSRDDIARDLLQRTSRICRIDTLDRDAGTVVGTGSCGPSQQDGMDVSGTVRIEAREAAQSIDGKVSINVLVRGSEGASERVRVGYTLKWTRLGDCGG